LRISTFLLHYARRHVGWAFIALLGILTYALATVAMVSLIEPIFGEVLLSSGDAPISLSKISDKAEEQEQLSAWVERFDLKGRFNDGYESLKRRFHITPDNVVYFTPLLLLVAFVLRSSANFVGGYAFQHIGLGATTEMRNDLFKSVVGQSSHFHEVHPSGELMSHVVNDVTVMQNAVSTRVLDLFQQSVTLIFLLWLLFTTNFWLASFCLLAAPPILFIITRFGKGMRSTSHRSQERMADVAQLLSEAVRGHRIVQSFGMEEFEHQRFRAATQQYLKVRLHSQVFAMASGPAVEIVAALGSVGLLTYSGYAVRNGTLTAPLLIQFLTNLMLLYDPIRKLNKVNLILQEALAAAQRVAGMLAVPNDITERRGARAIHGVDEVIAFEGVTFGYGRNMVLNGIDLEIKPGEVVALVGPSGAGKTTLAHLLPRFFDPVSGRVKIDGVDIREVTLASLRSLIGMVTQETVLFDGTIRDNIAYGRAELPLSKVREAAESAYADRFILEMPDGYETEIGEAGSQLSGGQRQRLAIARALLKNAPFLILDEATSHLDTESEAVVQKALHNLMQGRTTLVIAHRLSTVKRADRIVVMERGTISELGTHEELLAAGGTYKRLYDLQFRDREEAP